MQKRVAFKKIDKNSAKVAFSSQKRQGVAFSNSDHYTLVFRIHLAYGDVEWRA